jgi:hypothetical protein
MQVAPNQISPGEPFDVFYFVRNPLDNTTYYVRAKLYDVRTGEVLDVIALDQSPTNSRLFIKTIQAPADPSGYGRNIVAIASVYTDSAFTTQSDAYAEQEQYYLIKAVPPMLGGGGIDFHAFRKMVDEVVGKRLAGLPKPDKAPDFPSEALFGAIGALQRETNRIPKEIDLSAVSARLEAISAAVEALPPPEKTDLSDLIEATNRVLTEVAQLREHIRQVGTAVASQNETAIENFGGTVLQEIESGLKDLMGRQELTIPLTSLIKEKQPTPSPISVDHLM